MKTRIIKDKDYWNGELAVLIEATKGEEFQEYVYTNGKKVRNGTGIGYEVWNPRTKEWGDTSAQRYQIKGGGRMNNKKKEYIITFKVAAIYEKDDFVTLKELKEEAEEQFYDDARHGCLSPTITIRKVTK